MNPEEREALHRRWIEIDQELRDLADARVFPGDIDPATRERQLLEELDAIDYQLGEEEFHRQQREQRQTKDYPKMMTELAMSFPSLRQVPGIKPWDPIELDHWAATSGGVTHGSLLAARFVLAVWNPQEPWQSGRFDLFEALHCWDAYHKRAFLRWLKNPFFP